MTATTSSNLVVARPRPRRLLAGALTLGVLTTGIGALAAPADAAETGPVRICVAGTQGQEAKIKISRRGEKIRSFRLAGCVTRKLPAGRYRITQTAPKGYRTVQIAGESGSISSGGGQTSSVYLHRVKPAKRTVFQRLSVEDGASPSVEFTSKRHRR